MSFRNDSPSKFMHFFPRQVTPNQFKLIQGGDPEHYFKKWPRPCISTPNHLCSLPPPPTLEKLLPGITQRIFFAKQRLITRTSFVYKTSWLVRISLLINALNKRVLLFSEESYFIKAMENFFPVFAYPDINTRGVGRILDSYANPRLRLVKTTTLHVHHAFCTSLCRHCTTTTWKCVISRYMENVNKRRQIFLSLSKLKCGPQEINSREIRHHLTFSADWNNRDNVWLNANLFSKWRFRCLHRRRC